MIGGLYNSWSLTILLRVSYWLATLLDSTRESTLALGRSQIEWKLKAKTQISVFPWANIGQNDHSNPYIESTTVYFLITVYNFRPHRKHAVLGQRRSRLLLCRAPVAHTHISTFGIYSSHGSRENVGTETQRHRQTDRP